MSDTNSRIDDQIKKQTQELAKAKDRQAVQAELAGDYLDIKGVRFYKPTLAHVWFFQRLKHSIAGFASYDDFGCCVAYALAQDQKNTRNKVMSALTNGTIVDDAYAFLIGNKLEAKDIDEVLEKLAYPVLRVKDDSGENQPKKKADRSSRGGGQK